MTPCRFDRAPASRPAITFADLSAAKAYRSYVAVTGVGPLAHHFVVWYHEIEPTMLRLRVRRGAAGRPVIDVQPEGWGGIAVAPRTIPPIPPRVAAVAHEARAFLCSRCRFACKSKMMYEGTHRVVNVLEFIPLWVDGRGTERVGWRAITKVAMDGALSRIIGNSAGFGAMFGVIRIPTRLQWVPAPPVFSPRDLLSRARVGQLAAGIAEAARRYHARAPARSLASLVPADAPTVPPGVLSSVVAKITLRGRPTPRTGYHSGTLRARFGLRDAVLARGAAARAEVELAGTRYRLQARLSPLAPRHRAPKQSRAIYHGTLALRLEDDRGHTWRRSYPVYGRIDVEGRAVVAPRGLQIPGSCPPRCVVRDGWLPGPPPYRRVEIEVNVVLAHDFG